MTTDNLDLDAVRKFMNEPLQRQAEVKVGHRYGYWCVSGSDTLTTDEIKEADDYLEAHIQWRIEQANLTTARERDAVVKAAEGIVQRFTERAESEIADSKAAQKMFAEGNDGGGLMAEQYREHAWRTALRAVRRANE